MKAPARGGRGWWSGGLRGKRWQPAAPLLTESTADMTWEAVLLKEAVYNALTLCSYNVFSVLDADTMLVTHMIPDAISPSHPPDVYAATGSAVGRRRRSHTTAGVAPTPRTPGTTSGP